MASTLPSSGPREVRNREPATTRRHLLTARGSLDVTPRVVLRLPDLDALSAVAIGPPHSAKRRRLDSAHVVERADSANDSADSNSAKGEITQQWVRLLRAPVLKGAPPWLVGGATFLGKALITLQQPKMALAAIVAIALQLAAVLAMLVGNGKTDVESNAGLNHAGTPVAVQAGPNDPIQTPHTVFGGGPSQPPQTLPGLDAENLPPWPTDANAPTLAGPLPAPSGAAMQPAKLGDVGAPTLAPAQRFAPPSSSTPTLETSDAAAGKPKAKLQGTIKKISTRGTTP